ncbi:voltage-gated potassium channel [Mycolicibacterium litorale]|uniref:Voltage-gated potassium channel n=1 Tax=Mycolicibacterium litorale TaxID=758802 RepID=A0A6S6P5V8_9MYCO|nr:voltage-gated potassium channel [Mycolicibacterium litorale]
MLLQPRGAADTAIEFGMKLTYFAFVIDYLSRLSLARPRGRWFVRHLFDLAIVALPFLRPLRLLSLAVVVKVLQRAVGQSIRGRVIVYTACGATVIIYAAALAILEVERGNPDAKIANFGDAVWWAITTVTTVGYGEFFPVTFQGRMVAVALMIGGISLVGVVTATLASWIIQRVAEEDTASQAATVAHVEQLRAEVRQLREALEGGGTLDRSTPMP